ncbi:MAG TPA: diaminopimelate decarboxylase [Rhizomicrobium sp.]|nr:diaminopimelate decarboxylase [Rhizomicrobium sp.]
MNHFAYRHGLLHAEDVDLSRLAEAVGTPFYCYSTATLERHYRVFAAALPSDALIAFSVKANGNLAVLRTLARLGAGADVVSGGELKKALAAGVCAESIVFSGVGKTKDEMRLGLAAEIAQFNVESEPELETLDETARAMGKRAKIAFRVNPDVDARTHAKISTGTAETKFGIPIGRARKAYRRAASLEGVRIAGVDLHIGSQITELGPFEAAFRRAAELVGRLRDDGHAIESLDLGGGLGAPYARNAPPPPDPAEYGALAGRIARELGVRLILEPGRLIAANAGILVSRVLYVKEGEGRRFLILDAGMNDLLRPALYEAYHEIVSVEERAPGGTRARYDVVGPVCETADLFARDRELPALKAGDLVAFLTAGAYGAVMSSAYNARPPAPEVLVKGDQWSIVRPRLSDDALIALDRLPPWLEDQAR